MTFASVPYFVIRVSCSSIMSSVVGYMTDGCRENLRWALHWHYFSGNLVFIKIFEK